MVHSLLRMRESRDDSVRPQALERDLRTILDTDHAIPIQELNVAQLLTDLMSLLRDHRLRLATDYVVMLKDVYVEKLHA